MLKIPQYKQRQCQTMSEEHRTQYLPSVSGSRHSTRRLSSPLDFADSIPFNELKLSTETLGSGSFGTVFKGRWRNLNVAVKHFKTREEIDSFSIEVKQLSRVRHPNIVKLYGASSPSKTAAYLVMEYAEGGSLNHLLHECKQQNYDIRHACSWALQTARGVAYLHSLRPKPIMHRDLKPANLLLFSRGKILKICDFGTACAVRTQMTNNTGSASYMAPEVFSTSSYLESGDVFSWSIIFWEILMRQPPYHKQYSNPYQILWRVNQGTRPKGIEDCPDIIWSLITRSWDKDPDKRPTMKQVAQEMELISSFARASYAPNHTSAGNNLSDTRSLSKRSSDHQHHQDLSPPQLTEPQQSDECGLQQHHRHVYEKHSLTRLHQRQHISELSSVHSHRSTTAARLRCSLRRIELLQKRHDEIQDELKCDRKNSTAESFEEFSDLRNKFVETSKKLIDGSSNRKSDAALVSSSSGMNFDGDQAEMAQGRYGRSPVEYGCKVQT